MTHPMLRDGLRALALEEFRAGRDILVEVVQREPDDADAWAYLSGAHLALANVEGAQAASERALEISPGRFAPRLKAGELALRLGDTAAAESWFLAALRTADAGSPDAAAARTALVIARQQLRRSISHRAVFPKLIRLFRRAPLHVTSAIESPAVVDATP